MSGKEIAGSVAFFADLAAMCGVFIYGSNSQRQERKERQDKLLEEKRAAEAQK
jgi:hypothetical protein